jgi:hypothetical protein
MTKTHPFSIVLRPHQFATATVHDGEEEEERDGREGRGSHLPLHPVRDQLPAEGDEIPGTTRFTKLQCLIDLKTQFQRDSTEGFEISFETPSHFHLLSFFSETSKLANFN